MAIKFSVREGSIDSIFIFLTNEQEDRIYAEIETELSEPQIEDLQFFFEEVENYINKKLGH